MKIEFHSKFAVFNSPGNTINLCLSGSSVSLVIESNKQEKNDTIAFNPGEYTEPITEGEAMNYPRFDEDGNILEPESCDKNKSGIIKFYDDWKADQFHSLSDYENETIYADLFNDSFDYARSNENGWFYSDHDD